MPHYRSSPDPTNTRMPPGIPYIIGNELAERFSFYGMKGILVIFMTQHLLNRAGNPAYMSDEEAKAIYHLFTAAAYFFPLLGALLADIVLGKYRTILFISLMYCVGHGCLALMDLGPETGLWGMKPFLFAGLILIAIGAGGIKPCVSAHVGDQFGSGNKRLLTQVFNWFYFSINLGAAASTLLTPIFLAGIPIERDPATGEVLRTFGGPWLAFGVPGVLMAIATFVFWLGRNKFVHVPPAGWQAWKKETFSPEGKRALLNLAPLFLIFVPVFWALFDQTGSAWVLQADKMDREMGFVWLPSQIQAINPLLILTGIPLFTYVIYPLMGKFFEPTPLRKIGIGLGLTAFAFVVSAMIERDIETKERPIAAQMFLDLSADAARAGELQPLPEQGQGSEDIAMRWTRAAVSAGRTAGWKDHAIAAQFNLADDAPSRDAAVAADASLGGDDLLAAQLRWRMENKRPFSPAQISGLFGRLADPGETATGPNVLNAAVVAARSAKWEERRIVAYLDEMPNIFWQFIAYVILTSAEILVSIVSLEFAYTQSPRRMKSFIMGVYFLGVSLGNFYVSGVNAVLESMRRPDGSTPLTGEMYYWFFAGVMVLAWLAYMLWARTYKGHTFIQGEDAPEIARADAEGTDVR